MDFDSFTATQAPDMQVNCGVPSRSLQICNIFRSLSSARFDTCKCTKTLSGTTLCVLLLTERCRFESWFQGRGVLTAAALSDCPFENACKLTGSQPYTPSYDTSGRSSGSVGELRSRTGASSKGGPSTGDTLQTRVREIYLSALKARDRQDGGESAAVALETVVVSSSRSATLYFIICLLSCVAAISPLTFPLRPIECDRHIIPPKCCGQMDRRGGHG